MSGSLNQEAYSEVSLAGQIQFVFNLFLSAIMIGASMLSARYWGKGDKDTVEKILGGVLRISIPISLLFRVCAIVVPEKLMSIFTTDIILVENGVIYLRAVSVSYLMGGISQMYLCIMKNSGRALCSSIISSVSVLINIGFNAILIFGLFGMPEMGIAGIFCAGGDSKFGFLCDAISLWCIIVPAGLVAAFVFELPVLFVYFIVNLDEVIKLPVVWHHYKNYGLKTLRSRYRKE